ncbi:MAG: alanine:cation symporter family protein, partial [Terrimicrobiaceae bacterium]|nr:alanine:cation symporter family protein [Terrimicrobiaceae bacterium]
MQAINAWLEAVAGFVWGPPLILLLFGTHLFLTVRTGFVQRHLLTALRLSAAREPGAPGDVSQFAALATALAATIGTGNIYGVAGAVLLGGPGAVFWMWLTGIFGMATKYGEALLAVKYRVVNERGQMSGGPMHVLERALGWRWAGVLFAIFTAVAGLGIGNMAQADAIASMLVAHREEWGIA